MKRGFITEILPSNQSSIFRINLNFEQIETILEEFNNTYHYDEIRLREYFQRPLRSWNLEYSIMYLNRYWGIQLQRHADIPAVIKSIESRIDEINELENIFRDFSYPLNSLQLATLRNFIITFFDSFFQQIEVNALVFLSKFMHCVYPEVFPIFDRLAVKAIRYEKKRGIWSGDIRVVQDCITTAENYFRLVNFYNNVANYIGDEGIDKLIELDLSVQPQDSKHTFSYLRIIDKYYWLKGKILEDMSNEEDERYELTKDEPITSPPSGTEATEPPIITELQCDAPLFTLRGEYILPNLTHQGMEKRIGRGLIKNVIALNNEQALLIATGGACLFDLGNDKVLWEIDCPANCGAISPDGSLLALGARDIYLWDLSTGQILRRLSGHTSQINSIAFSPDGKLLASGGEDGTLRLWDIESGLATLLAKYNHSVNSITFNFNGELLASGGSYGTLELWQVETKRRLRRYLGHQHSVSSVTFSPDGSRLASGSMDQTVRLWSVSINREVKCLAGRVGFVGSITFSQMGVYWPWARETSTCWI